MPSAPWRRRVPDRQGRTAPTPAERLLEIEDLTKRFPVRRGVFGRVRGHVHAVDGVSFALERGRTLGIVGESGCGKSVLARSIMRLLPPNVRTGPGSSVLLDGRNISTMSERELRRVRGRKMAIIFQDPMTSLNPVLTVSRQIGEALELHLGMDKKQARERAIELLELVGIPSARDRINNYPHQFSGGMRQRVMIAMGLSCDPQLLIADEPTTALDVTIQAQILELLQDMKTRFGMAVMLITHAMGVVAETAQRVAVMYAGKVVEEASVEQLFSRPRHPYTVGLIRSIPRIDTAASGKTRLEAIGGVVPSLVDPPPGCRFAPRCHFATAICREAVPPLREIDTGHKVACVL
ncbi:MAG: ABC transporter ATP-binding protein [Gammaproteobacteria bacterium]